MGLQDFILIWIKLIEALASKCGLLIQGVITCGVLNMGFGDFYRSTISTKSLLEMVQYILVDELELYKRVSDGMVIFWC
jgi:hypothetical protein